MSFPPKRAQTTPAPGSVTRGAWGLDLQVGLLVALSEENMWPCPSDTWTLPDPLEMFTQYKVKKFN